MKTAFPERFKRSSPQDKFRYNHGGGHEVSFDRIREKVSSALHAMEKPKSEKNGPSLNSYTHVKEVFPNRVVYEKDGKLMARSYTCEPGKDVEFGDPYQVELHYTPQHGPNAA